jgi:hypothetical protein
MPDPFGDAPRPCIKCGRELPAESFSFQGKSRDVRRTTCKDCVKAYSHEHYLANRDVYIERAKSSNGDLRVIKRELIAELKAGPCADCKRKYPPECMEFDHVNGRTITGRNSPEAIANMKNSTASFARLREELARCDLVCSNCHRIRTHRRRQSG